MAFLLRDKLSTELPEIIAGTSIIFNLVLTLGGVAPDITADTVTITFKKTKDLADPGALQKDADVTTQGDGGIAVFELTEDETEIDGGQYFYDIIWYTSTREYGVDIGSIFVIKRVSDF
jgi:hypothetical protein